MLGPKVGWTFNVRTFWEDRVRSSDVSSAKYLTISSDFDL